MSKTNTNLSNSQIPLQLPEVQIQIVQTGELYKVTFDHLTELQATSLLNGLGARLFIRRRPRNVRRRI